MGVAASACPVSATASPSSVDSDPTCGGRLTRRAAEGSTAHQSIGHAWLAMERSPSLADNAELSVVATVPVSVFTSIWAIGSTVYWNSTLVFGNKALIFSWVSGLKDFLAGARRRDFRKEKACSCGRRSSGRSRMPKESSSSCVAPASAVRSESVSEVPPNLSRRSVGMDVTAALTATPTSGTVRAMVAKTRQGT